jgi:hypothetical protein
VTSAVPKRFSASRLLDYLLWVCYPQKGKSGSTQMENDIVEPDPMSESISKT